MGGRGQGASVCRVEEAQGSIEGGGQGSSRGGRELGPAVGMCLSYAASSYTPLASILLTYLCSSCCLRAALAAAPCCNK